MNRETIRAIFNRNFYSYFINPTGYVFICVFVLLSTLAAFWNDEFFAANLANLDQLTPLFPFVMLVFIPAVTMSIWADERRLGTDELLLTLPAGDAEIVLGKFLAAVAIYSVSLIFSGFSNLAVLEWLGTPDLGLFFCTYAGFWFLGMTMISIGMAASFLTSNITISYLLGAILNAPLVFAASADTILGSRLASLFQYWSFSMRLEPFGRGILSLTAVFYFAAITILMLYFSMILIGARRWNSGQERWYFRSNFIVRLVSLAVMFACLTFLLNRVDIQADCTAEQLNSLSPETVNFVRTLDARYPVEIHAYVSPEVPEMLVDKKIQLEAALRKFQNLSRGKIRVRIHRVEYTSEEAKLAEQNYGIVPEKLPMMKGGNSVEGNVFFGMALTCGPNRDVIPFLKPGLSVEYELMRSLLAVTTQQKRKTIGVVQSDAYLMGGIDYAALQVRPPLKVCLELERSYNLVSVNATEEIAPGAFDVLLVVQPSSLLSNELTNIEKAIQAGVPTAIFEDPMPTLTDLAPTGSKRWPRRDTRGFHDSDLPKTTRADRARFWKMLGVSFSETDIVAQKYAPIRSLESLPAPFIFVDKSEQNAHPFSKKHPAAQDLRRLAIPYAGYLTVLPGKSGVTVTPLIVARANAGTIPFSAAIDNKGTDQSFGNAAKNPNFAPVPDSEYILSADILQESNGKPDMHVILTADSDLLSDLFFDINANTNEKFCDFDNVAYVLNVVDCLAGETLFCPIRGHKPIHRKLDAIDRVKDEKMCEIQKIFEKLDSQLGEEAKKLNKEIQDEEFRLSKELSAGNISEEARQVQLETFRNDRKKRLNERLSTGQRELKKQWKSLNEQYLRTILATQNHCKLLAVAIPPIFPLLLAVGVFLWRRQREMNTVSKNWVRSRRVKA